MERRVEWTKRARTGLRRVPPHVARRARGVADALASGWHPRGAERCAGPLAGQWRVRLGAYRIRYTLAAEVAVVLVVDPRGRAYRQRG